MILPELTDKQKLHVYTDNAGMLTSSYSAKPQNNGEKKTPTKTTQKKTFETAQTYINY